MSSTTIKVSRETRDRLEAQASASGLTLGEHVDRLADAADRGLRVEALRKAIAATPAELLASHDRETQEWVDAELGA